MNNVNHETIADIVAEMRAMPEYIIMDANAKFVFAKYADRIEEAAKHELAQAKEGEGKYEYAIEQKDGNVWIFSDGGFSSIERVKDRMQVLRGIYPKDMLRIVRRPADWEVVE